MNSALQLVFKTEDVDTLARWFNSLSEWGWPNDLPDKPEGYDELPPFFGFDDERRGRGLCKKDYIDPLARAIREKIGAKECLRYHHLNNLNKTNEQFEEWWKEYGDDNWPS